MLGFKVEKKPQTLIAFIPKQQVEFSDTERGGDWYFILVCLVLVLVLVSLN